MTAPPPGMRGEVSDEGPRLRFPEARRMEQRRKELAQQGIPPFNACDDRCSCAKGATCARCLGLTR